MQNKYYLNPRVVEHHLYFSLKMLYLNGKFL